jgi:1-deoxyxylulose-5-phosphate synthase
MPSTRFSPLALGTADWASYPPDELDRVYSAFRSGGQNTFDSAHCYAFWTGHLGQPEKLLGQLVRKHESHRRDVHIVTKGGHVPYPGYPRPHRYLSPEAVRSDFAESLDRLNTDYVDHYLLHRDDPRVPPEELISVLDELVRSGQARAVGVSNWLPHRIARGNRYAELKALAPISVCQAMHTLAHVTDPGKGDPTVPVTTDADLSWYQASGLPMLAFSATANGYFSTGKSRFGTFDNPTSQARAERCKSLGNEIGKTPMQVAIAYLLNHPFPCTPLLATRNPAHLQEAIGAINIRLTPEQSHWLRHG